MANASTPNWEKSLQHPAFQMEGADFGEGEGSRVLLVNSSTLAAVRMSFNIHWTSMDIYRYAVNFFYGIIWEVFPNVGPYVENNSQKIS